MMKKQHKVEARLKWEIKVVTGHHKKKPRENTECPTLVEHNI